MTDLLARLNSAFSGHYRIERELGRGGMATVYLAQDLKHHRPVAIKVLHAQLAASLGTDRFLREIEISARLTHPTILPLHDSGQAAGLPYYVMPYVEGPSLRDRLDHEKQIAVDDTMRIARDIADALAYAHGRGVIHRDIKPENILFSSGRPLVADFGIAKAIAAAGSDRLTDTGLAVGTPAYMSPEQASGDPTLDPRSDVYGLACVVYEMLGGTPPFTGPSPQAVMARHSTDPVPNLRTLRPTVTLGVQRALEKALAKVPADRFSTPAEFAEALERGLAEARPEDRAGASTRSRPGGRAVALIGALAVVVLATVWFGATRVGGTAAEPIESLAVLPLHNVSGDPDQQYFADGIQDALIGELAQISALRVISFTSALHYKNSTKSLPQIAQELGVTDVVEGSYALEGDSVRIQVQLVQALPEERHLWARTYSRDMRHVLSLYGDVAQAVARGIQVELTPDEATRLAEARPVNPETYEAILRGKSLVSEFTADGFERGLTYLQGAVDRDPDNALAHAALALGYSLIGSHSPNPPADAMRRAQAAAERAVALDSTLAEPQAALALIKLYGDWDWEGARTAFLRALRFNPNLAEAHAQYAWYLNLMGEQDSAVAEMKRAMKLDPLEPKWTTWLGDLDESVGHWDDAIARLREALDKFPDFPWAYNHLGFAYSRVGRHEEAIAAHRKAIAANPGWEWSLAAAYAAAGRIREAHRIADSLARAPQRNPYGLAFIYTRLGEVDEAMRWAEAAYNDRVPFTPWFMCAPFEPLHASPRFEALRQRLNLPSSSCSPDQWPRPPGTNG